MRILVLNYEFPPLGGGASPVSYELSKGYVERGHKVDVVTMGFKGLKKFEVKDGINIYRVPCFRSKKEICYPHEMLSYVISAKHFLKKHMKKNKYDICHCHFIIPTGPVALWLKKKYELEYIITSHGSDVPGYNNDRFKFLHLFTKPFLKRIVRGCKSMISPSNYLLNLINKNIFELGEKGIVIPNGIEPSKFTPKKKKKIILSTGRLLPRKGFDLVIKAISENDLEYEFHICGDGPMMDELKKLALKSKTKVILHGWLDNNSEKYKDILETASIYILASAKENASVALLEAMSSGCVTITTNISGCPETVGNAGIVVERNIEAIKEGIQKAIKQPELGKEARERIMKELNWNKLIKKYEEAMQ